jgi:hypothetical protein
MPVITAPMKRTNLNGSVRCRPIEESDLDGLVTFLTASLGDPNPPLGTWLFRAARKRLGLSVEKMGLPSRRRRNFWETALSRMGDIEPPHGYPKYGYILAAAHEPVGVLLLIFARTIIDGEVKVRCNVSSWYVAPAFRTYATLLVSRALSHKNVTFFNITPSPATWPILEAQGFGRFCAGTFISVPLVGGGDRRCRVFRPGASLVPGDDLSDFEVTLLRDHEAWGCLNLVCCFEGRRYPFVFSILNRYGCMRYAQLIFSRSVDDFVRFARPLGLVLARSGVFLVACDADGPIAGLVGVFKANDPKYFKGPDRPRMCDLAFTERAVFGF